MKLRTLATTTLVGSAVALLAASPASAALSGTVTLGQSTVAPGGSTTATVSVAETVPVLGGTQVITTITPGAGATGAVTFASSAGTANFNCVPPDPTEAACLWTTGSTSGGASFTVNASASAAGAFLITTVVTGDDPDTPANDIVPRTVGTATLTVQTPAPTTAAPTTAAPTTAAPTTATPTTATPTTAAPVTTAAPGSGAGTLPATGPDDVSWAIVALALMALAGGGITVRLARRSDG